MRLVLININWLLRIRIQNQIEFSRSYDGIISYDSLVVDISVLRLLMCKTFLITKNLVN